MLVKLYELPDFESGSVPVADATVCIRRAMAYEGPAIACWVENVFGGRARLWRAESEVAFHRLPPTCFIAVHEDELLGFVCYDSTCKGFLGPIGVSDGWTGRGIGARLLLAALHAMRADGYGYAIVGNAGNTGFFGKVVGASIIDGSKPGIYTSSLKRMKQGK